MMDRTGQSNRTGHRCFSCWALTLTLTLIGAAWLTLRIEQHVKQQTLLNRAKLVTIGIDSQSLRDLTLSDADLQDPNYQRLKQFLTHVREDQPDIRFAYIMMRTEESQILIMADSESPESEDYSPPGDLFHEAPLIIHDILATGVPQVYGPVTDRWGTWISAYVPLQDPLIPNHDLALGIDIDASLWRTTVWRSALLPYLYLFAALLSILAWTFWLWRRRETSSAALAQWGRIGVTLPLLLTGLSLSLYAAYFASRKEAKGRSTLFHQMVHHELEKTQRDIMTLTRIHLPRFAQFFEAVDVVTLPQFELFMAGTSKETDPFSWAWIRATSRDELPALQHAKQVHFDLWEPDDQGMRRPAQDREIHYPVFFVAPKDRHINAIGADLASLPERSDAIAEATASGLPTATRPIRLMGLDHPEKAIVIFHPVYFPDRREGIEGFALAGLTFERFFSSYGEQSAVQIAVHPHWDNQFGDAIYESSPGVRDIAPKSVAYLPLFGQTIRIAASPGPLFRHIHRPIAGAWTFITGILSTIALTIIITWPLRQRRVLENLVRQRTTELDAIQTRFELLTSHSGTYIWEIDHDGLYTYVSGGIREVLGYSPNEIVGKKRVYDLCPPEDKETIHTHSERSIALGHSLLHFENRMVHKNGSIVWVSSSGLPIRDAANQIIGFRGTDRDITKRKQFDTEREAMLANAEDARRVLLGVVEDQQRTEDKLRNMDRLLQAGAKGAQQLLAAKDLETVVPHVLAEIGEASDQDRIIIFETPVIESTVQPFLLQMSYEWVAPRAKVLRSHSDLHMLRLREIFPHWHEMLLQGKAVSGNTSDFPEPERSFISSLSIVSGMMAPIFVDDRFWGLIYMSNCREPHEWTEWEQAIVTSVATAIGAAIARRRTDDNLAITESRNAALLSALPDLIFLFDAEGRYIDFKAPNNQELYANPDDFMGRHVSDVLPANVAELVVNGIRSIAETGQSAEFTYEMTLPTGNTEYYESRLVRCGDGFLALVRNISEVRLRTEESLRLYTAIEQSPVSVMITNAEGLIEYVNPTFEQVSGYLEEEVQGQSPRILKSGYQSEEFYTSLWKTIVTGAPWTGRMINRRKNGDIFTEEVSIAPVRNVSGQVTHYVAIKRDITEELARDELLRQSQKMDSIGRLAGGIAHDFNNLLGIILGNTELALEMVGPDAAVAEDLEEIRKAAKRSADLTRQLLGFARRQPVNPVVVELNEIVGGMLKMLRRLIDETVELRWEPRPEPCPIRIDPSQLDQIIVNLCVNARDAIADTGRIVIRTAARTLRPMDCTQFTSALPGDYIVLSIEDNGCGMDKDTLAHAFEPFYTTKEVGQGTGLGLATVYGIVNQNYGFIHLVSEEGVGTRFDIYLPLHKGETTQDEFKDAGAKEFQGNETLLLVEDEKGILTITKRMLEKQGYTVLTATTPEAGIEMAQEYAEQIDLLITDVIMPGMNGRDMYDRISSFSPNLKCLYISGYSAEVLARNRVVKDGLNFLQKPFTLITLARQVRTILDSRTPPAS